MKHLCLIPFWTLVCGVSADSPPRVTLPQGYVAGVSLFTESNGRVNAFLGLPYALPPIGSLRFAPPERHPGWNRTLVAGHFRPDCPQLRLEGQQTEPDVSNEDCLYLNIFAPQDSFIYRNYPVVVFIHGIDYVSGSPLVVSPEELAAEGLIVVTFSYRLNVFGFLTFEDEFARGNLGLLDQYMAVMWVRENIQYFGGLPNNITLMGHGSGASSILVHMTSPRTKSLFQKAILMSGSVVSPWLMSHPREQIHPALTTSRNIARSLGCYGENYHGQKSKSVLSCMRQKSSDEIMKAFQSSYQNGNWSNALGPISDDFLPPGNQYLPVDPTTAIKHGQFHQIPILTGITCNEGTVVIRNWRELIGQSDDSIKYFIKNTGLSSILQKYNFHSPDLRSLINWNYFEKVSKDTKLINNLLKLYNDAMFAAPFWTQTNILSTYNRGFPVFVYLFAHPSYDYIGNYVELLNLTQSSHGSDLLFFFGPAMFQQASGRKFTAAEERLSVKMKRLLTYFIRQGDPTPPSYSYKLWDPYDVKTQKYLKFHIDPDTGRNLEKSSGNPDKESFTFWNSLLPQLQASDSEKMKKFQDLLVIAGVSNLGAASGACSSYKSAMFTALAFLILLLVMLVLSLVFLKKRTKERDRSIL